MACEKLKSLQCRSMTYDGLRTSLQLPFSSDGTGPPAGQFAGCAAGLGQGVLSGVTTATGATGWALGVSADMAGAGDPHAARITTAIRPDNGLVDAIMAREAWYRCLAG